MIGAALDWRKPVELIYTTPRGVTKRLNVQPHRHVLAWNMYRDAKERSIFVNVDGLYPTVQIGRRTVGTFVSLRNC